MAPTVLCHESCLPCGNDPAADRSGSVARLRDGGPGPPATGAGLAYLSTRGIGDDDIDRDYAASLGITVEDVSCSPDRAAGTYPVPGTPTTPHRAV